MKATYILETWKSDAREVELPRHVQDSFASTNPEKRCDVTECVHVTNKGHLAALSTPNRLPYTRAIGEASQGRAGSERDTLGAFPVLGIK